MARIDLYLLGRKLGIILGMTRRGFLNLFSKATLGIAAAHIPIVSAVAKKLASKCGFIAVTINESRVYIPFWN